MLHLQIERCLDAALEVVCSRGGQVLEPEALEVGTRPCALVLDTEGNRIALYTEQR